MIFEPLTTADLAQAMEFVEAAGWNQTPEIWQRFIAYQPAGCFKAILDGRMVGTVTSTSYEKQLAWIGMMLVAPAARRQGVGRGLMQRILETLNEHGVATIKLDATPMGRPLYESLGFIAQYDFHRWRREASGMASALQPSPAAAFDQLPDYLLELDRRAFGVQRTGWLRQIALDAHLCVTEHGYGMLRPGRLNPYLGPIIAKSLPAAAEIIESLCRSTTEAIVWDIPKAERDLYRLAEKLGFVQLRTLTRMCWNHDLTEPALDLQWAICDPASG